MAVRDEIREQRKKLKGQGFKAHWDYFWEYYKIHTIVAVIALIFLGVLIRDISNNKPYALYALFVNSKGTDAQSYLQDEFSSYAGIDTSKEQVLVDNSANFLSSSMDQTVLATSEKIMALLSAKEMDVMVADEQTLYHYASQETFTDLRSVYSSDEIKELEDAGKLLYIDKGFMDYLASDEYTAYLTSRKYDKSNKYAVMAAKYDEEFEYDIPSKDEMDDPVPVGIILDDSAALMACNAYPDATPVVGIVVNTQRQDVAKSFVEFLMK